MALNFAAKDAGEGVLSESLSAGLTLLAMRALGNREDAADAAQETLVRALEAIRERRIPTDAPLGAFIYGIARHVIADVIRKRVREGPCAGCEGLVATEPSPLDALILREERDRVTIALTRLSEEDRALLRDCYVDGHRIVDIAGGDGEPAERIRKRKSRALARLRAELGILPRGHVSKVNPMDRV